MYKFKDSFYTQMHKWQTNGKQDADVFSLPYDQVCAYLWYHSSARTPEEKTPEAEEFALTNYRVLGDAEYHKLMGIREYCKCCGETYKFENLSICVDCGGFYCYRCTSRHCSCGGELVG